MLKKGAKIRCTSSSFSFITKDSVYTLQEDQDGRCVRVIDDDGDEASYSADNFAVVPVPTTNGTDASGNPVRLSLSDLQIGQRFVTAVGGTGMIGKNDSEGNPSLIYYNHDAFRGWDRAEIGGNAKFRIVELYDFPHYCCDTFKAGTTGPLLWKAASAEEMRKAEARFEKQAAIEALRAQLVKQEAELAAI